MSERKGWPLAVEERASGRTGEPFQAERLRARDRSALDQIMALYWQPVVACAERLVASRDAPRRALLDSVKGQPGLRGPHELADW